MTDTEGSGSRARTAATRKPMNAEWGRDFLAHLASTSNVTGSAKHAGVGTTTAYEARRTDPEFNRKWQQALLEGYEHLELELLHRLRAGEVKQAPTVKRRKPTFDNATAFRLLSLHRETIARQRALQEDEDEEAILAAIDAKLDRMRHRQLDPSEPDAPE